MATEPGRYRLFPGLLVGLVVAFLSILPQVWLGLTRQDGWSFPYVDEKGDQTTYLAYVNALIEQRPRRNNPYTGREDHPGSPERESFYSIQFVPAYSLAITAREFRISASAVFFLLSIVAGFSSALALYMLIVQITSDELVAVAGVLVVLLMGSLVTDTPAWEYLYNRNLVTYGLPFLRRYEPAFPFPFFIAFFLIYWRICSVRRKGVTVALVLIALAVSIFAILVFSYFFLWTAVVAWLASFVLVCLIARAPGWQRHVKLAVIVGSLFMVILSLYLPLLWKRTPIIDIVENLTSDHRPRLFHIAELVGIAIIALLYFHKRRGRISFENPRVLFAAAFACLPILVFNQQLISGRVLQQFHYEIFVANYSVLIAAVLVTGLLRHKNNATIHPPSKAILICFAVLAVLSGLFDQSRKLVHNHDAYKTLNNAKGVALKLSEFGKAIRGQSTEPESVVIATDPLIAEYLPSVAPQPMLWAFPQNYYSGITLTEDRERFLKYLYYTGMDPVSLYQATMSNNPRIGMLRSNLLLLMHYESAALGERATPTTELEFLDEYSNIIRTFDREGTGEPRLAFLVIASDDAADLKNLDRWYERSRDESIGHFLLYRLKLRSEGTP